MKHAILAMSVALLLSGGQAIAAETAPATTATQTSAITTRAQMLEWYRNAKFGMFIHWGIFSPIGKGEWSLGVLPEFNNGQQSGLDAYKAYAPKFNTNPAAIAQMVKLAKDTGMRYIILVSRHHDGFSLWDSKASPYARAFNSTQFGTKVDMVKAFADECAKQGLKLMLYYSLLDWTNPDYPASTAPAQWEDLSVYTHLKLYQNQKGDWKRYRTFMKKQLGELLTQYGPIGAIWFDGYLAQEDKALWNISDIYSAVRTAQATTLIANNKGIGASGLLPGEDFTIGERGAAGGDEQVAGESVDTSQLGNNRAGTWGYLDTATIHEREWIFRQLIDSIANSKNFVLNIGPRGDGSLQDALLTEFAAVGAWVRQNAEAIYDTQAGLPGIKSTTKTGADGKTYLYLFVPDAHITSITLTDATVKVRNAVTLVDGKAVALQRNAAKGTTVVDFASIKRTPREPLVLKLEATIAPRAPAGEKAAAS